MKWSWPMRKVWQWIPAGVLLVAVVYCSQPQIPPIWLWLTFFGLLVSLYATFAPHDFKAFLGLNEKPRGNGTLQKKTKYIKGL